jgi:antitoxin ParD1/3/4
MLQPCYHWGKEGLFMSNVQKVSVALTPEIVAMLKDAVDTGEYTSTSEVVREALRAWKMRRTEHEMEIAELRRLWNEGIDSGPSIKAQPVFRRLRYKYARQAATE